MARGITQSDVDQAADALLLGGERPTVDRIRQHLGTGSPNTVTRLLDVWWKALGSRLSLQQRKVALPDAPEAVASLASQLWEQALVTAREHADTALAEERGALATARLEADSRVAAAQQALEAAREAEAQAVTALSTAHDRFVERQRLVDQQTAQLEDLARQRDEAIQRITAQETEVTALRARLDAQQSEAAGVREAQAAHLRAVEDRAHAEIDRARQETRELKQQLQSVEKSQAARIRQLEGGADRVEKRGRATGSRARRGTGAPGDARGPASRTSAQSRVRDGVCRLRKERTSANDREPRKPAQATRCEVEKA
jgi:DNA repair exonuclease SbcCD ATPase subunit